MYQRTLVVVLLQDFLRPAIRLSSVSTLPAVAILPLSLCTFVQNPRKLDILEVLPLLLQRPVARERTDTRGGLQM